MRCSCEISGQWCWAARGRGRGGREMRAAVQCSGRQPVLIVLVTADPCRRAAYIHSARVRSCNCMRRLITIFTLLSLKLMSKATLCS